ncbi:hypothetical protein CYK00_10670 [Neisseria sicca]|uniref:Uncharacterized protein n=1 Tax=Neisseria sicca TaxID=490 RepID=A0A2I1XA01_NEISI|nr:hypothetical protein HMPREF2844_03445 [Neisseria sp. HMSC072F04]PLA39423.1 hypothetical protein CYK00_10670 [Neisseria sicca]
MRKQKARFDKTMDFIPFLLFLQCMICKKGFLNKSVVMKRLAIWFTIMPFLNSIERITKC